MGTALVVPKSLFMKIAYKSVLIYMKKYLTMKKYLMIKVEAAVRCDKSNYGKADHEPGAPMRVPVLTRAYQSVPEHTRVYQSLP